MRPLVPFCVGECVVKQLTDIDGLLAEICRQLLALKHMLLTLPIGLDRKALASRLFPPLLTELIEVANPPNS